MKYTIEMASDGMIYVPRFMQIGAGILTSGIRMAAMLVLLIDKIYEVHH
jgi:hypothetical protein